MIVRRSRALALPLVALTALAASSTASCKRNGKSNSATAAGSATKAGHARDGKGKAKALAAGTAQTRHWREDIDKLVSALASKHKDAFFKISRARFEAAAAALKEKIAELDDAQAALGVCELVARLGDAHTRVGLPEMARVPLALYWFDDGVFIAAAAEQHADLVGAQLLSIGNKPIADLLRDAAKLVAVDNASGRKLEAPRYVVLEPVLARLGALGADGKALLRIKAKGAERSVSLAAVKNARAVRWRRVQLPRTPLRQQKPRLIYWNTYLADSGAVYMRYRRCASMSGAPMPRFASGMLRFIDLKKVSRVIVDLRGNGGGNSRVLRPLVSGLAARRQRLTVRVIVDRAVFSSALLNAIELKQLAGAKIVGEPTSGKPNHYGEVRVFKLPHSQLPVQYSTNYFRKVPGDPPTLAPDVPVAQRARELLAGKDPALEAALHKGVRK